MRDIQMDYTTTVVTDQGLLEVVAQVTISKHGDYYLDWWDVEGKMQHTSDAPDKLQELFFELADDNMREDV